MTLEDQWRHAVERWRKEASSPFARGEVEWWKDVAWPSAEAYEEDRP